METWPLSFKHVHLLSFSKFSKLKFYLRWPSLIKTTYKNRLRENTKAKHHITLTKHSLQIQHTHSYNKLAHNEHTKSGNKIENGRRSHYNGGTTMEQWRGRRLLVAAVLGQRVSNEVYPPFGFFYNASFFSFLLLGHQNNTKIKVWAHFLKCTGAKP